MFENAALLVSNRSRTVYESTRRGLPSLPNIHGRIMTVTRVLTQELSYTSIKIVNETHLVVALVVLIDLIFDVEKRKIPFKIRLICMHVLCP